MEYFVQFSDETQSTIISVFGAPQDPAVWPNQGQVTADDPRWTEFASRFPPGTFDNINP